MKTNLTKQVISTLPPGTYGDTKVQGLMVSIPETLGTGVPRYGVYVSINGRPMKKTIGPVSAWSVDAARAEAQRIITELRAADPALRQAPTTMSEVVELYTKFLKSRKAKDTEYMETITNLYWPHLRPLKLTDIKVFRLQEHHDKLAEKRGPGAARYAIACLSTLFNYAIRKELATYNPAVKVDVAGKTSREVFLDEYEISVMRECLGEMAPTPRAYFLMALLTGARRENLASMEWGEIDLESATWIVPAEKSKNSRAIEIPLVPEAVELLRGRRSLDSRWVFPAPSGGYVRGIDDWVKNLRQRMRLRGVEKHFTVHDLRRTFATRLAATGASLPVIAQALGHRGLSCVGIYARASTDTVRAALGRVG
jgi:integrase